MRHRLLRRSCTAWLLALCLTGAPSVSLGGNSLESALGGGQGFLFIVDVQRDGSPGIGEMRLSSGGEIEFYRTQGRTTLESERINFVADFFDFDGINGVVTCTGSVEIRQDGVRATCEKMVYTLATGEIVLTGNPRVEQDSDGNRSRFSGMEEFFLQRFDSGATQIRMSGGDEILCEMLAAEPAASEAPLPTPPPVAAASTADETTPRQEALSGVGFAGLGRNVIIRTRPRADVPGTVLASINEQGVFSQFNAFGSVVVESDDLRLRSDELEYDAIRERVEARRNVYVQQGNIEADCQFMTYEIATGRIELSGNPDIRETRPDGIARTYDMAAYIITRSADGSVATRAVAGPDGPFRSSFTRTNGGANIRPTDPIEDEGEIRLDNDADLRRLTPTPRP